MNKITYPIIQSNGQRIYNSPAPPRAPLPKGSEIFVGNLPRDLYEDELIPLFSQVGPIYKLRLMMDFSGRTRGFAFVNYYSVAHAKEAILRFNNRRVRSKSRSAYMTVNVSLDNCRLFFGNIPKNKCTEQIETELIRIIDGVVKVIVYAEKTDPKLNRGFAFVEFESHATAAIARRKLLAGVICLWGNYEKFYVDWAEPEPIVDPMVLTQVKILYFKNVPVNWSCDHFRELILTILKNIQIVRIYKRDNYAFVHFYDRIGAEMALKILESVSQFLFFYGKRIEVEWARPANYSKKYRENHAPDNLCTSVPPRLRRLIEKSKRPHGAQRSKNIFDDVSFFRSTSDDFLTNRCIQHSFYSDF